MLFSLLFEFRLLSSDFMMFKDSHCASQPAYCKNDSETKAIASEMRILGPRCPDQRQRYKLLLNELSLLVLQSRWKLRDCEMFQTDFKFWRFSLCIRSGLSCNVLWEENCITCCRDVRWKAHQTRLGVKGGWYPTASLSKEASIKMISFRALFFYASRKNHSLIR